MPIVRGFGPIQGWKKGWATFSRFEILSIVNDDSVLDPMYWKAPPGYPHWKDTSPFSVITVCTQSYLVYPLKPLANFVLGLAGLGFILAFYGFVNWFAFKVPVALWIAFSGVVMMPVFWWVGGAISLGFNRIWPFFYRHCLIFDRKRKLVHIPHWRRGWDRIRWEDAELILFDRNQEPLPIAQYSCLWLARPPFNVLARRNPWPWQRIELQKTTQDYQYANQLNVKWLAEYMNGNDVGPLLGDEHEPESPDQVLDDDYLGTQWWELERWPPKALFEHYKKVGWKNLSEVDQLTLQTRAAFAKIDPDKLPSDPTWWRDEEGNWNHVSRKPMPEELPALRKTSYFRDRDTGKIIGWRGSRQLEDILEQEHSIPKFDENDIDWEARERHFEEKYRAFDEAMKERYGASDSEAKQ